MVGRAAPSPLCEFERLLVALQNGGHVGEQQALILKLLYAMLANSIVVKQLAVLGHLAGFLPNVLVSLEIYFDSRLQTIGGV